MEDLPKDIKMEIADKLTNQDLLIFCNMVSKKHLASVFDENFWEKQFKKRFKGINPLKPTWKASFVDRMKRENEIPALNTPPNSPKTNWVDKSIDQWLEEKRNAWYFGRPPPKRQQPRYYEEED